MPSHCKKFKNFFVSSLLYLAEIILNNIISTIKNMENPITKKNEKQRPIIQPIHIIQIVAQHSSVLFFDLESLTGELLFFSLKFIR